MTVGVVSRVHGELIVKEGLVRDEAILGVELVVGFRRPLMPT